MAFTFGIIDIGSNTIRMNIYSIDKGGFKQVMTTKNSAGLVSYVHNGVMNDEGITKLEDVLTEFKNMLDVLSVTEFAVFATASLRNVKNSQEILDHVQDKTGIRIDLLSGSEEGRLSFNGAIHALNRDDGIYIDTGGGSTEVVLFDNKDIVSVASMPIGSLNLYNRYVREIIPTPSEIKKISKKVQEELFVIDPEKNLYVESLAVTGGSMRAVRELMIQLKWIRPDQFVFKPELLDELVDYLAEDESRAIKLLIRVKPDRVHTVFTGLLIIQNVARFVHAQVIEVSFSGVREGYLLEKVLKPAPAENE